MFTPAVLSLARITCFLCHSFSDKAETTKSADANLSVKHHKFGSTVVVIFRVDIHGRALFPEQLYTYSSGIYDDYCHDAIIHLRENTV